MGTANYDDDEWMVCISRKETSIQKMNEFVLSVKKRDGVYFFILPLVVLYPLYRNI